MFALNRHSCFGMNELTNRMNRKRLISMKLNKNSSGFTLLELIISLVIAGTLVAIAIPAFNNTISSSRVTSNTNLLVGIINYAKSEAISRQVNVLVRRNGDIFEVVADPGGANEESLREIQPPTQDVSVTSNLAGLTFNARGFREFGGGAASIGNISIKDSKTEIERRICVSIGGSVSVTDGEACT